MAPPTMIVIRGGGDDESDPWNKKPPQTRTADRRRQMVGCHTSKIVIWACGIQAMVTTGPLTERAGLGKELPMSVDGKTPDVIQ